jgi:hypothetical protein
MIIIQRVGKSEQLTAEEINKMITDNRLLTEEYEKSKNMQTDSNSIPTIEVNLWEYNTLVEKITITNQVKTPGIIIVNNQYYMLTDNHKDVDGLNYTKTTAYHIDK